ncbi:MAG: ATP-binding cassette domain-containing protein [Pseudomonadaceae bacterium]|nr:ATP-binding cassette domain-containing protein [Pseudomonadaceae bacterium]
MKLSATTSFLLELVRPYWGRLAIGVAAMLVTTACMLVIPQYLKKVFDAAIVNGDLVALNWLMVEAGGMVLVLVAGVFVRSYVLKQATHGISWGLVGRMFGKILGLDIAFFERKSAGDIIARSSSDVIVVREFIETGLPMMVRGLLLAIGAYAVLVVTDVQLTLLLSVALPFLVVLSMVLGRRWKRESRFVQDKAGESFGRIEEAVYGIRIVRAYGNHAQEMSKMQRVLQEGLSMVVQMALWRGMFFSTVVLLGFFAIMSVVWFGGMRVIEGQMSMGEMMAFLLYLAFLGDGVSNLANFWPAMQTAQGAMSRIMEVLGQQSEVLEAEKPKHLPKRKARGVVFEGVAFAYASRPEVKVADGVDFAVKAGEKVAVVGPSGAGKSTLFSLLLRFYDVQGGRIMIDGVDIRELAFADLRRAIAVVAQEASVFSTTVRANVAYGRPDASDEEVWKALKVAHADGFVRALPQGLETPVGEKGVQLSGGQRQRLAIARAVLVDAPILLLDEATSHLDAESERAVQEALEAAGKGRTVITIAHRLSTVRAADKIVVMDKGRVVAEGTHRQLLAKSPLYKALATLQMVG